MRFLRFIPRYSVAELFLWLTIAFCVGVAVIVAWLAPYFREEWTLWVALSVMVGGLVVLSRRRARGRRP